MKRLLMLLTLSVATAVICQAGDMRFYDQHRNSNGTVESDGFGGFRFYDQYRTCYQTAEPDGFGGFNLYDQYRNKIGSIEPQN